MSSLLLSISHTLHHSRILYNKCSLASLELQLWWNTWWGSASDPWSAQLEARLNVQHLQQEKSKTRFGMRRYINDLSFNIYTSLMFRDWYVTHPVLFSLHLSASLLSLPSCVSSLGSILLTLSPRSLIDILGEALQRERGGGMKVTHTISADALPSTTNNSKNHKSPSRDMSLLILSVALIAPLLLWIFIIL